MNIKPILLIFAMVLALASGAVAQMNVTGEVVDVIDGKTVVILLPSGKVRAELQYIDVPETGQQLNETVREHLRGMLVGKIVEYRARTIYNDRTVGRILVNGIDVSQQMLRDGAAWHIPAKVSAQESAEAAVYSANESNAKDEKRGVWSVAGLRPGWEVRAEKAAAPSPPQKAIVSEPRVSKPVVMAKASYWGDKNPQLGNVGALANGYNEATKSGYIGTSFLPLDLTEAERASGIAASVDITYFYKVETGNKKKGFFVITFASVSPTWRFLAKNDLVVTSDGKSTTIGKAKRTTMTNGNSVQENLTYTVPRSAIAAIANGNEVVLKVGDRDCVPRAGLQYLLYNMLQVTE